MIVNVTVGTEPNIGMTTEPSNSDANQTPFDLWASKAATMLHLYYTPILIILGAIGNLASVFVFYSSKLRLQSTSQYLSALAVSDTLFLLQLLPPWLSAAQITNVYHYEGLCQIFMYISYVTCCLSAWLVVAFTIERFVAVLYPLRRNLVCSVTRSRQVIIGLVTTSLVLNLPVIRFAAPKNNECNIDRAYLDHAARFNMVDTALSFTVPLTIIIILNAWIMVGVYRLERARHQLMKADRQGAGPRARPLRALGCPRSQQRVTRMLLIVSSVFVILNLPAYTIRILAYAYDVNSNQFGERWAALQQVSVLFFNTNFGINFILYCLSGQKFRSALIQSLPCLRKQNRRAVAVRRAASNPARASSISSSFGSNCTEATTNCAVVNVTPHPRRRPSHFITRWTFDNSRQRQINAPGTSPIVSTNTEEIEMQSFGGF